MYKYKYKYYNTRLTSIQTTVSLTQSVQDWTSGLRTVTTVLVASVWSCGFSKSNHQPIAHSFLQRKNAPVVVCIKSHFATSTLVYDHSSFVCLCVIAALIVVIPPAAVFGIGIWLLYATDSCHLIFTLLPASMLERLVTTLLSLDYLHQKPESSLTFHHSPTHSGIARIPTRCRSNSLSSSSSSSSSLSSTGSSADSRVDDRCDTSLTVSSRASSQKQHHHHQAMYQHHGPPHGVDYDRNDTVFGAILRGDLPAMTLAESGRLLAIQDIKPRAPLHALIIPKAYVGSVFDVDHQDEDWLIEIKTMALDLIRTQHPDAYAKHDFRLCFHIPPFNSVNHLHLHVLAPLSQMTWYYRYVKYNPHTRWCIGLDAVMERLASKQSSVPYRRPITCKPQKEMMLLTETSDKKEDEVLCLADDTADSDDDEWGQWSIGQQQQHPIFQVGW